MTNNVAPKSEVFRKGAGRPRRISLEEILKSARELGLENLSMSAVARDLNVNLSVLYGYISGRDELIRLAAAQVTSETDPVANIGQSWPIYAAQTAKQLYAFLTGPGQLIPHYISGRISAEVELERAEAWVETMCQHGFSAEDAIIFHQQLGEVVIGGAVTFLHSAELVQAGKPFDVAASAAIQRRREDLPLLSSSASVFGNRSEIWKSNLYFLIEYHARKRGVMVSQAEIFSVLSPSC